MLLVLSCYWGVLIYYLGAQWSFFEQYHYAWSVPVLCLYLIWNSKTKSGAPAWVLEVCRKSDFLVRPAWLALGVVFFALFYTATRVLHETDPLWRISTLAWVLLVLGMTLLLVRIGFGARRLAQLAFPICFFLAATPWPSFVEGQVTRTLTRANAGLSVDILNLAGTPAVRQGNLIEVGTGTVGIDEACSGIRSLQAILMLSLFLGELYRLSVRGRFLLVAVGVTLSFFFNLCRTTLLAWIAAHYGMPATHQWHDPAGVSILVGCFLGLWALGRFLIKRNSAADPRSAPDDVAGNPSSAPASRPVGAPLAAVSGSATKLAHSSLLPRLSLGLLASFIAAELTVWFWYAAQNKPANQSLQWSVHWPKENTTFQPVEMRPGVREMLKWDYGAAARWQETDGSSWQGYFFKWLPVRSLYQRVRVSSYHNPEVCNAGAGWALRTELPAITLATGAGFPLNFRRLVFEREGRLMHLFLSVTEYDRPGAPPCFLRSTHWDKFNAALAGTRIYGQRTFEIAAFGIDDPEQARAALERQLPTLIQRERENTETVKR